MFLDTLVFSSFTSYNCLFISLLSFLISLMSPIIQFIILVSLSNLSSFVGVLDIFVICFGIFFQGIKYFFRLPSSVQFSPSLESDSVKYSFLLNYNTNLFTILILFPCVCKTYGLLFPFIYLKLLQK